MEIICAIVHDSRALLYVQQNSFNPMSKNLEILIIQHLRGVVPGSKVLLFTRKKLQQWNRQILRDLFKKAFKSVSILWYILAAWHQLLKLRRLRKHRRGH